MTDFPGTSTAAFPAGTFRPAPARASTSSMVAHQGRIETFLFLRHGEQLLLSLIIPVGMLVLLARLEIADLTRVVPVMLAIAVMSSGFTGQAIALAFDRRYGALKRTGASGVPAPVIIAGKVIGVLATAIVQLVVISAVAMFLGWRPDPTGLVEALPILLLGVGAFTSLGLLMGGTLKAELVLGVANLIWVVLSAAVGISLIHENVSNIMSMIPSVALAHALTSALSGGFELLPVAVLLVWWVLAAGAAARWFRFSG